MSRTESPQPMGCMLAIYPPPLPAVQRPCMRCPGKTSVWVSLSMLAEVDTGSVEPMCLKCLDALFRADPEAHVVVTPVVAELLAEMGLLGWADRFTTSINRRERRVTGEWVVPGHRAKFHGE